MSELKQQQSDAAQEFVDTTLRALQTERGIHAETAVAALARMAGTFLFRSFGNPIGDFQPGQILVTEKTDQYGPNLVYVLGSVLSHLGVSIGTVKLGEPLNPDNRPLQSFLETQRLLEPALMAVGARHNLSLLAAAEAGAVATALLIQQSAGVLDPNIAFSIAVNGFIEGTKTAPDPVIRA